MIHYSLVCDAAHEFDGWFRDSATFDAQASSGVVVCPYCHSTNIAKAVMAPHVARKFFRARPLKKSASRLRAA